MSLSSASSVIGGLKEYMYRGIQQLPLVLASTSLLFTVTTGSVAHATLMLSLSILVPLYTYVIQKILGLLVQYFSPTKVMLFSRATGDTCNIIQKSEYKQLKFSFDDTSKSQMEIVPSYWLMSVSFFFGYLMTNSIDSFLIPSQPGADPDNIEKRSSQAIYCMLALSIFLVIVLGVRLRFMRDCEGRSILGLGLAVVFAAFSMVMGRAMYNLARTCGGRASDLLGVLSQILPAASTSPHPIVCATTT